MGAPGPNPLKSWKSKMTCWPLALIRSGLFGSMPSAMMPTLMPDPFTIWFAAATFMTSRASGSTSGLAGLLGQICCVEPAAGPECPRRAPFGKIGPAPPPSDAKCRMVSGTTVLTAGLPLSRLTSAGEIVAEIALMMWKLCTCVAWSCRSSVMTPAWAALAARIRRPAVARLAGRLDSWFLKMMIERWVACAARRSTWAAVRIECLPLKTVCPGARAAAAVPLMASGRSPAAVNSAARRKRERKRMTVFPIPSRNRRP